jgi:DNA repair exonuclease SbcCD nuclease subunit
MQIIQSKSPKRIAQFTDIHFGAQLNSEAHNIDCLNFIDWFIAKCKSENIDTIMFLGDWFEARNSINILTLNYAIQAKRKLNESGLTTYFLIGNHDLYHRHNRNIHSIEYAKEFENIIVIDQPTLLNDKFLLCPYLFKDEYVQISETMNKSDYAFGHFEFRNFYLTGTSSVSEHGFIHKLYSGPKYIFSGHFHKRQASDNVIYIGNPFGTTYADINDPNRGMCILDVEKNEVDFIDWEEGPMFYKTTLSKLLTEDVNLRTNSRVKCLIDIDISYSEAQTIKSDLTSEYNLREFILEENIKEKQEALTESALEELEELDSGSLDESIKKLIKDGVQPKGNIDPEFLIQIYDELLVNGNSTVSTSQEVKILDIKFKNFKSFGNVYTEINFEDSLSTFVYGKNLDADQATGAGKSSFFEAIAYAIYDKSISDVNLPKLINTSNASKTTLMDVQLRFSISDIIYTIKRSRGSEDVVLLLANDKDITPDSKAETNKLITSIIGISYELFSKIVVFSGANKPFLSLSVGDQRTHIEELFNVTILSEKAEVLKKKITITDSDIKVEEALLKEKQNNINAHIKRIELAEQQVVNWETNNQNEIDRLKKQIDLISNIDFEKEQQLIDSKLLIEKQLSEIKLELNKLVKDEEQHKQSLAKLTKELLHLEDDKCPYCQQDYINNKAKIKEIKTQLKELNNQEDFSNLIEELINTKQQLESELKGIVITYPDLASLLNSKNNLDNIKIKLTESELAENPHFKMFEQLEQENIATLDYSKLDNLKVLKENQAFLNKLLTDKNSFVRRKIINKTIPFLNARLNYYTIELGLPHLVNFDDNMSCTVSQFGRELDFGMLSSGEKKKVNLSMSLAFRDILHHLHAKINILLVDEIDQSLCMSGVELVVKLLKKKTKEDSLSTWVVMHRLECLGRFDRDMLVQKKGGFSEIIFDVQ